MQRRINWTNRKRIGRGDILIRIDSSQKPATFSAELRFKDGQLPSDARVVIDVRQRTTMKRFGYGTVGRISPEEHCNLQGFSEDTGSIRFAVKVIAPGSSGRILAEARNVPVEDPMEKAAGRRSILPVEAADLGQELYRVSFDGVDGKPVLRINNRVGDVHRVARSAYFRTLVLPEILRQVLQRVIDDNPDISDSDLWQNDWIRFGNALPDVKPFDPETGDSDDDSWLNSAVTGFCNRSRTLEQFMKLREYEDNPI